MTVSIDFRNPESGNLGRHISSAAERRLPMVEKNCLATARGAVICGLGPVSVDQFTAEEAVQRISLVQRTLLLATYLESVSEP